jgi:methyl-accepting chemotaxis protein
MATGIDIAAKGTATIISAVEGIRGAAEDTSTASEGVAKESQDMAASAERLRKLLGRFRVIAGGGAGVTLAPAEK